MRVTEDELLAELRVVTPRPGVWQREAEALGRGRPRQVKEDGRGSAELVRAAAQCGRSVLKISPA